MRVFSADPIYCKQLNPAKRGNNITHLINLQLFNWRVLALILIQTVILMEMVFPTILIFMMLAMIVIIYEHFVGDSIRNSCVVLGTFCLINSKKKLARILREKNWLIAALHCL